MAKIKAEYVKYFEDVPVQKYAAMYIGRDEDTIIRWRKEDPAFADAVKRARAIWVRKRMIATKAEFALERLEKDLFTPREEILLATPKEEQSPEYRELLKAYLEKFSEKFKEDIRRKNEERYGNTRKAENVN